MPAEFLSLLIFLATFLVLLLMQPIVLAKRGGMALVMGNRDDVAKSPTALEGRLSRTVANSVEAAVLFVPLALIAGIMDLSNPLTQWGSAIFAAARIGYAFAYVSGIKSMRSAIWNIGLLSTLAVAAGLLAG